MYLHINIYILSRLGDYTSIFQIREIADFVLHRTKRRYLKSEHLLSVLEIRDVAK